MQICPKCYSDKIHVRIGASNRHAKIDFSSGDDFYECPACDFYGNVILEGNDRFIAFLREQHLAEELLKNPAVAVQESAPLLAPAQTQLVLLE